MDLGRSIGIKAMFICGLWNYIRVAVEQRSDNTTPIKRAVEAAA
jgi:hypothetical protein